MRIEKLNALDGVRFGAIENETETLIAEAKRSDHPNWISISWRGSVDADGLFKFFDEAASLFNKSPLGTSPSKDNLYAVIIFGPKTTLEYKTGTGRLSDLRAKVPTGAEFLRLDYLDSCDLRTIASSEEFEPDISVWSPLVDPSSDEPSRINVWAAPHALHIIAQLIPPFVSKTHIDHITRTTAELGVKKLVSEFSLD